MDVGWVVRMTEIPLQSDEEYKRVLFTIKINNTKPRSKYVTEQLAKGNSIKLVHSENSGEIHYWKMILGRNL
jgi:hypothetical protein